MAALLMATPAQAKSKQSSPLDYAPSLTQSFTPSKITRREAPKWAQAKVSAAQAKSIARRQHPGSKFVDISRNGDTWRVRLIKKDGRVVDVLIDANTGRVK